MHAHPAHHFQPSSPFLKWAGGKVRLLPQLLPQLPKAKRLIEPFVGAGAVFLAADYDQYLINDANADLVAMWVALQARPREFVERAQSFFVESNRSEQAYKRIRSEFNGTLDRFERAARLPYLNRFGFNGLFRVNSKGEFNVPYGKPAKLPTLPVDSMAAASGKLQRTTILNGGYAPALEMAGVGDVVYCDPPYLDSSNGSSFTGYTTDRFGLQEHERLLELCVRAVSRGATVFISNHDTDAVRQLYRGWHITEVRVRRSIGSISATRRIAQEVVARLPLPC